MKWFKRKKKSGVENETLPHPYYIDLPPMPARRIFLTKYQAESMRKIEGYEGKVKKEEKIKMKECIKCGGEGTYMYGSTSTWRKGGVSGCAMTQDVCDICWGSGDDFHPGINLRELETKTPDPMEESAVKPARKHVRYSLTGLYKAVTLAKDGIFSNAPYDPEKELENIQTNCETLAYLINKDNEVLTVNELIEAACYYITEQSASDKDR